jgi:WD40 repeat protein
VTSLAISPDGRLVAVGGYQHKVVELWDLESRLPVGEFLSGHEGPVNGVAFSPDGTRLASASFKTVRLWNTQTRQLVGEPMMGHNEAVNAVAFGPDGHRLVSASSDNTIRLWDADTRKLLSSIPPEQNAIFTVAFSSDGHHVATGVLDDGTIRLWDVSGDKLAPVGSPLSGHSGTVNSVKFSPDGERIVSGSADGSLRLWPVEASPDDLCAKLSSNMTHEQWDAWVSPDIGYMKVCADLP